MPRRKPAPYPHGRWPAATPFLRLFREIQRRNRRKLCRIRRIHIAITAPLGPDLSQESGRHMQLKESARAFLLKHGARDAAMERGTYHIIVDVASEGWRIAVECGQTDMERLLRLGEDGVLTIWIPFRPNGSYEVGELAPAILITRPSWRRRYRNSPQAIEETITNRALCVEHAEKVSRLMLEGRTAEALLEMDRAPMVRNRGPRPVAGTPDNPQVPPGGHFHIPD